MSFQSRSANRRTQLWGRLGHLGHSRPRFPDLPPFSGGSCFNAYGSETLLPYVGAVKGLALPIVYQAINRGGDRHFHSSSQFSVLSFQFSVFSSQFSVLSSQFSVLSSQFSVLSSQFSVLSSQTKAHGLSFGVQVLFPRPNFKLNSRASSRTGEFQCSMFQFLNPQRLPLPRGSYVVISRTGVCAPHKFRGRGRPRHTVVATQFSYYAMQAPPVERRRIGTGAGVS
jgi:hypothetical protein